MLALHYRAALFEVLRDGKIIREESAGWKSSVRASTLHGELFLHSAFPTLSADAVFFGPDTYRFARTIKDKLGSRAAAVAQSTGYRVWLGGRGRHRRQERGV